MRHKTRRFADFDSRMAEEREALRAYAKADFKSRVANEPIKKSIAFEAMIFIVIIAILLFILVPHSTKTSKLIFKATNTTPTTSEIEEVEEVIAPDTEQETNKEKETETETETEAETEVETENDTIGKKVVATDYEYLTEYDISLICQAVQHETLIFEGNNNYDEMQQYMAASIVNRLGEPGFGPGYTTTYSVYDLLSNYDQFGNILWELDGFDPYDYTTRQNVYAVLNGIAYTPDYLFFERCSNVGEDYYSAMSNFYASYPDCYDMQIVYMEYSPEGRYIMFACNPWGAYASAY